MSKAIAKRANSMQKAIGPVPPKQAEWAIVDISGSTNIIDHGCSKRRIDYINAALMELGNDVQVIAFSDTISRERVGEYTPQGGTLLCPALREVVKYEPTYIVLISDGEINDSHSEAFGLVDKIAQTAIIDAIYIGPEDSLCEGFMRDVATRAHGRFRRYDPATMVEKMQTLLPAPDAPMEMSSPLSHQCKTNNPPWNICEQCGRNMSATTSILRRIKNGRTTSQRLSRR